MEINVPICNICGSTQFVLNERFQNMRCEVCKSAPRQRRIHYILNEKIPNWTALRVHEFAPFRDWIKTRVTDYSASQYYPDKVLGKNVGGFRNENIEKLTFRDCSIDLFLVEDLLEHIFDPEQAVSELLRTCKHGGWILGTVPLDGWRSKSQVCAKLDELGELIYLKEPKYHGAPAGSHASLVVWEYGNDFEDLLCNWAGDHNLEFFSGAMPQYEIKRDNRSTFLIRKKVLKKSI